MLQREDAPRLVILDWMMPGHIGPEVCRMVRSLSKQYYTYILLLTSRSDKGDLIQGMESGADDYLVKPFDHNELKVRLGPGRRIIELQIELLQAQEALREQATRDSLTKLWNRRAIFDILAVELARCQREDLHLGIVLGDLDQFKNINDTHGHIIGDRVLAEVGARMLNSVRPYDMIGRYGGEEFLFILPGCDAERTAQIAERVRKTISDYPIDIGDSSEGKQLRITTSFGYTSVNSPVETKIESLIFAADSALYEAKQQGRNRSVMGNFSPTRP